MESTFQAGKAMTIEARLRIDRGAFSLEAEFSIPDRGVTAIFGPSGSGKTTLLRAIAGLERGPEGFLRVGQEVWQDADTFVLPHQRPLGYVFQEASLFSHLSVKGNLEYGYKRVAPSERRVRMEHAVALLGVGPLMSRDTEDLSGGERQRVAIARALLTSPALLLLDEPLTGLDLESKAEIVPYLERLHEELEIPVLYVSHSPDEVARLADHLVLLQEGRVLASGEIREMLTRSDLPLFHGDNAEAILEARVAGHDETYQLTRLDFPGGQFNVTRRDLEIGQVVRLRILARDVSLTLEHQTDTSILNIFPVTVEELADEGPAQIMVRLSAGGAPILSRITRRSADALQLAPGKQVHAQIKTVALLA
jgi:molybdate transport system ATP-binding protein